MSSYSLEALLSLYSVPGIGPARMRKLISVLGSPEAVLKAGVRHLSKIDGFDQKTAAKIKSGPDENFVKEQLAQMKEHDVGVLTFWDESYPARLKRIYDPPAFLFYKGDLKFLDDKIFAVVGTRVPTTYGKIITEKLTTELVSKGFLIISGFARGIDTLAHKTALKNSASTIAVLGNGLDTIYPSENKSLHKQIVEQGVFLSEYPMGTKPDAGNFPKRNRIISGMSSGVLIPEAGEKSGALLTAMYALDQNREVFAIPGPVYSGKSTGTNNLIKNGAKLVQNIQDILEELTGEFELDSGNHPAGIDTSVLKDKYKIVYESLDSKPLHIDQVAIDSGLPPAETLSILLTLELRGFIRQLSGKMFIHS